jgi:hypothetical protein
MMRNILLLLLLFSQIAFPQSANVNNNTLSSRAIEAFTLKSQSKTAEFYSYLELLTNPGLNSNMKEHTVAEALRLFNGNPDIAGNFFDNRRSSVSVASLLEQAASQKEKWSFKILAFNAWPEKKLAGRQDWVISYQLLVNNKTTLEINQKFILLLEDKKFGKTTMQVWNSYLGGMVIK